MKCRLETIADDFWSIRGSFKIGGLIDLGTHMSLVKLGEGRFVLLDAYTLSDEVAEQILKLTAGADTIEAIINLHPFHTLHVEALRHRFPNAKLYGTKRHVDKLPQLSWQDELVESNEFQGLYHEYFDFSVPAGVDFISADEKLHFSSVIAYHRASKTIHVDDTFIGLKLPWPIRMLGKKHRVSFHPTLAKTLEPRTGAADDFSAWAQQLALQWRDAEHLCTAHTVNIELNGAKCEFERIALSALSSVQGTLAKHKKANG